MTATGEPGAGDRPAEAARRRLAGIQLVAVYLLIMVVAVAAGAVVVVALAPAPPPVPCEPFPAPCSVPPGGAPPPIQAGNAVIGQPRERNVFEAAKAPRCTPTVDQLGQELIFGRAVTLTDFGVTIVYNDCPWQQVEADGNHVVLELLYNKFRHAILDVRASSAAGLPASQLAALKAGTRSLNATVATDDRFAINGPSIGYEHGGALSETDKGQDVDAQGQANGNAVWTFLAATDGQTTLVLRINEVPETVEATRQYAQELLQNVHWSTP